MHLVAKEKEADHFHVRTSLLLFPLRVWVPGCATGEEVYSLAITLLEATGETGAGCPIQIFGTDVTVRP